jgi:hypothetical protein
MVLYPGSPQALDPGESGLHGAWIIELLPGNRFSARQFTLSGGGCVEVSIIVR